MNETVEEVGSSASRFFAKQVTEIDTFVEWCSMRLTISPICNIAHLRERDQMTSNNKINERSIAQASAMINRFSASILLGSAAIALAGCGGGGGGGGPAPAPAAPAGFTSFSALPKSATTTISGTTLEGSYTAGVQGVTSISTLTDGTGNVALTLDAAGTKTAVTVNGAKSSVSYSATDGSVQTTLAGLGAPNVSVVYSANKQNALISADYVGLGYSYQTYGIWLTGYGTPSGNVGAISVGSTTPVASIPTTGTATFTGYAGGIYVEPIGVANLTSANLSMTADFANRSISFATTNTEMYQLNALVNSPNPGLILIPSLNMTGTLTYSAGTNSFSGPISAGSLTGQAKGQFYGPAATEIGGTFAVKGSGVTTYAGAFGGKH
jgi:hypothetical protein